MKNLLLFAALLPVVSYAQIPTGTVSGQILTREGQPATEVRVSAIAVPEPGAPVNNATAMVSIGMTDKEGRYRLENVLPGRYYIAAGLVDLPTYYPGVTAQSGATAVNVLSGTPLTGINFTMALPQGVKVSGRVTTPTGTLKSGRAFLIGPASGSRDVAFGPDGAFEFQRVTPGSYQVTSSSGRPQQALSILVTDKDISGLQLVIIPTVNVSGTVVVDGGTSTPPRFSLTFSPFKGGGTYMQGTGNFSVPLQEGDYRVSWSNVPAGFEVKSISAGSVDLLTSPLKVSVVSPPPEIRIALHVEGNPWVKLSGKVTGVTSGRTLTLTGANIDQLQLAVKADGSFEIDRILPGSYTVRMAPNPSTPTIQTGPPIQFVVPNQDTTNFVIAMPVMKEVPGIVTNAAGAAVQARMSLSYSEVRANGSSGGSMSLATQPDGRFTVLMPEGDRRITVSAPGANMKSLTYGSTDLMRDNMKVTMTDTAELRVVLDTTATSIGGGGVTGGVAGGFGGTLSTLIVPPPPAVPAPPIPIGQTNRIAPEVARANLVSSVPPVYPPLANAARVQGTVVLQIQIATDGRVQDITVLSGHPLLNEAAVQAVRQSVYKPFTIGGQTMPVITTVNVDFPTP